MGVRACRRRLFWSDGQPNGRLGDLQKCCTQEC